jgi:hypothetical protein
MKKYIFLLAVSISSASASEYKESDTLIRELAQCYVAHEKNRNLDEANKIRVFLDNIPLQEVVRKSINNAFDYQRETELDFNLAFDKYCTDTKSKMVTLNQLVLAPNKSY